MKEQISALLAPFGEHGSFVWKDLVTGEGMACNEHTPRNAASIIKIPVMVELFRRLRHDKTRPLLQVADPLQKLKDLYQARDPLYREVAHHVLETGRPTVSTLVNNIAMQLEQRALQSPPQPLAGSHQA